MSDLISRKRIEYELCESNIPKKYREFCRRVINSESLSPSVDAVEVVHGHWAEEPLACNGDSIIRCSACNRAMIIGKQIGMVDNFCPNCGAKMYETKGE